MRHLTHWLMAASSLSLLLSAPCAAEARGLSARSSAAARSIGDPDAARRIFTQQVAGLAREAWRIDELFAEFATFCDATVGTRYDDARAWFGLWDRQVRAQVSGGLCRELFDQIVARGESVKSGMAAAESGARTLLDLAAIRAIRHAYSLDWDGWGLPAPGFPGPEDLDPPAPLLAGVLRA